jgi:hypothetical protein
LAAGFIGHGFFYHLLTDLQELGAYKGMVYLIPGLHANREGIK